MNKTLQGLIDEVNARERGAYGICAVRNCRESGTPHTCPADGASHGHGKIHYEACHSDLEFRPGWAYVCDKHFAVLVKARAQFEEGLSK